MLPADKPSSFYLISVRVAEFLIMLHVLIANDVCKRASRFWRVGIISLRLETSSTMFTNFLFVSSFSIPSCYHFSFQFSSFYSDEGKTKRKGVGGGNVWKWRYSREGDTTSRNKQQQLSTRKKGDSRRHAHTYSNNQKRRGNQKSNNTKSVLAALDFTSEWTATLHQFFHHNIFLIH